MGSSSGTSVVRGPSSPTGSSAVCANAAGVVDFKGHLTDWRPDVTHFSHLPSLRISPKKMAGTG